MYSLANVHLSFLLLKWLIVVFSILLRYLDSIECLKSAIYQPKHKYNYQIIIIGLNFNSGASLDLHLAPCLHGFWIIWIDIQNVIHMRRNI